MSSESGFTPLPPSGLRSSGPGLQESLHHYALRLASQCCLSLHKFEKFLLRDEAGPSLEAARASPNRWIGPRSKFLELLAALKRDTGLDNLHRGTFWAVADVLGSGGTRGRYRSGAGRAWCPACYLEWDPLTSSEPLIWVFQMLTACPRHGIRLEGRCSHCRSDQPLAVPYPARRTCKGCGRPLGHAEGVPEIDRQSIWVNEALRKFTEWLGEATEPITPHGYVECVTALVEQRDSAIRSYLLHMRTAQRHFAKPSISTLLNIAAVQGTTIQAVLTDPSSAASPNLLGATRFEGLLFRRRDLRESHRVVTFVLATLGESNGVLPPPSIVWLACDLWCEMARDICPLEHNRFSERYRAQKFPQGRHRFKRGVAMCLRLLHGENPDRGSISEVTRALVELHGHSNQGADACISAALNLRNAIRRSQESGVLQAFEKSRREAVAQWAGNLPPDV